MLKVNNLSSGYNGIDIVKNINFEVEQNSFSCLLGANGCGKTTLIRAMSGEIEYSGETQILGENVEKLPTKKKGKKIGVLSQLNEVLFPYTVYETVLMGRYPYITGRFFSNYKKEDFDATIDALKVTNIFDLKDKLITELSGGQLQRVFLARLFAQSPEVILLDEPTNHLDLKYQIEIMDYLKSWVKEGERCVLAVLHDVNLAMNYSDKLLLMYQGKIIAHGEKSEIEHKLFDEIYGINMKEYMQKSLENWV